MNDWTIHWNDYRWGHEFPIIFGGGMPGMGVLVLAPVCMGLRANSDVSYRLLRGRQPALELHRENLAGPDLAQTLRIIATLKIARSNFILEH